MNHSSKQHTGPSRGRPRKVKTCQRALMLLIRIRLWLLGYTGELQKVQLFVASLRNGFYSFRMLCNIYNVYRIGFTPSHPINIYTILYNKMMKLSNVKFCLSLKVTLRRFMWILPYFLILVYCREGMQPWFVQNMLRCNPIIRQGNTIAHFSKYLVPFMLIWQPQESLLTALRPTANS